jgi:hypothetical protein
VSLDGVVLVAWEHEAIVEKLLPAIAGGRHLDVWAESHCRTALVYFEWEVVPRPSD